MATAKTTPFATTVQETRRIELFKSIALYQRRLTTTKRTEDKRVLKKEIINCEKEMSKLPIGMLTAYGAEYVNGPVEDSELVKIWLTGAHEAMFDEISPEIAYFEYTKYISKDTIPLTLEYFKHVFNIYR